jgi:hypothetical protein
VSRRELLLLLLFRLLLRLRLLLHFREHVL